MRLLQVSLRSLLLYSIVVVVIIIPISLFSIREMIDDEVDNELAARTEEFVRHIKGFENLADLETDLLVMDRLMSDITIQPYNGSPIDRNYQSVSFYDSLHDEVRPFRQLSTIIQVKGKQYLLTTRMSLVDNNELVSTLALVQVVLIVLLIAGLLLLNRSLSRKLWKPFYSTLEQLKAYELDKTGTIETSRTNIVEFDDLNKAVNLLTDRNRKVFLEQKEFIENASHELQTPLAIFQSKLDNLMQNSALSEADANTLLELESAARRMARLNQNLLLISKIDNSQFTKLEPVDVAKLTQTLLDNTKTLAQAAGTEIAAEIGPFIKSANPILIEILLTNLFQNAIRHNEKGGSVIVTLSGNTLMVFNTGEPLRMSPEKLFERFSKESKHTGSTGLGLAIAKKICDSCGYKLSYEYTSGRHIFKVLF